ncbi:MULTISPECIES: MMPL family transporter [Parafrankia]|uniref:MMPL family transporter n=1 Tax=Parafrankia TaxID=2994362 RepID=UPI0013F4FA6B|nr:MULTISPECIES: MMPL family transporter [Parafrankia]MBE3200341.1 MMPL family transporter [Parafrankia sp. CH37]
MLSLVAALYIRDSDATYTQQVAPPDSQASQAMDRVAAVSPDGRLPDLETVVLRARRGTLADPLPHGQMTALIAEVSKLPGVLLVAEPTGPLGPAVLGITPVSDDQRTAMIAVMMKGGALSPNRGAVRHLIETARAYDGPELQVEMSGPGTTMIQSGHVSTTPLIFAVLVGLILVGAALRSQPGIVVCLISGAAAALLAVAATAWLAHKTIMTPFAPIVTGMLAFGICLGGAVVVVYRMQSALLRGEHRVQAAVSVTASSGAAMAAGGLSLTIATLIIGGLGLSGFGGIAFAAATVGAITSLVMLTLLPALIAASGTRLLGWTDRHYLSTAGTGLGRRPGLRSWWATLVGHYPAPVALAAGILLLGLAAQISGVRLGGGDDGTEPTSMTTRRAYDLISDGFFPGMNGPILVAVDQTAGARGGGRTVPAADIAAAIKATPGVMVTGVSIDDAKHGIAVVRVLPAAGPRTRQASDLVRKLREDVLPAVLHGSVTTADVGGPTALFDDAAADFRAGLPMLLFIVLVSVAMATFLVVPSAALAAVLGACATLSVLASTGALRMLFQSNGPAQRLGVTVSPVEPYVLVPIIVAVFGLAPGMNLILLMRLGERSQAGPGHSPAASQPSIRNGARRSLIRSSRDGIRHGHADLGHIVLTMNMVMLIVFAAIAAQPPRALKMMGLGLAAGVAVEALLLRMAIIPAAAHLCRLRQVGTTPRNDQQITVGGVRLTVPTVPILVGFPLGWQGSRWRNPSPTRDSIPVPNSPRTPDQTGARASTGTANHRALYRYRSRIPRHRTSPASGRPESLPNSRR